MPGTVWVLLAAGGLAGCAMDPKGTLTLMADPVPSLTAATVVTITGSVARSPQLDTRIVVRGTGAGGISVDTLQGAGRFILQMPLAPNRVNLIGLTATDYAGSPSDTVSVSIRQSAQGPTIAQATPADTSDNVSLTTTVQVILNEPGVMSAGGGVVLSRQGVSVAGTSVLSPDSLTLTFTPATQLSPNAVYQVSVSGLSDVLGNPSPSTPGSCFVTTMTGATATFAASDSAGDFFYDGTPQLGGLLPPDLIGVRLAREGSLFSGIFRFTFPHTFSTSTLDQATVYLDLDTDQDSTTGFQTFKDFLFSQYSSLGGLSSGTRAEYVVGLEPHPQLGDSAYIGKYTSDSTFQATAVFLPVMCGAFMGFVVPFDALGGDDGKMNAVAISLAANTALLYFDPLPTQGHLAIDLSGGVTATDPRGAILPAPFERQLRRGAVRVRTRSRPRG